MKVGSLFTGIGGLDLGLEQAGMKTIWQVEKDATALKILEKHWPNVPKYKDVRDVGKHNLERPDVIAGGFPCQDVSKAGNRAGITGKRSGLWSEMLRITSELLPDFAVVENVSGLLESGIGRVLGDLAEIGYDAEWESLPALAFGASHLRDRVFIVAYPNGQRPIYSEARRLAAEARMQAFRDSSSSRDVRELRRQAKSGWPFSDFGWLPEPDVVRVVHGVPSKLDAARIRGLGNAVVPAVGKWIGERIIAAAHDLNQQEQTPTLAKSR